MNILITGATGFVGSALTKKIGTIPSFKLAIAMRSPVNNSRFIRQHIVGDLSGTTDWSLAVRGQQVVIHVAARAHIMKDDAVEPLTEYRRVNVEGTLNLARQAAKAGVKRFIFISSIKVNGEITLAGQPFKADDLPNPVDSYGRSKFEAEQGLLALSAETGMELVIIRPPLVYGAGVKGNFRSLIRLVARGLPLPLGKATLNRRSMVALDNLVDLILVCLTHPCAANEIFLVSDGEDLSTAELLQRISKALQRPLHLVRVPTSLLILTATIFGKKVLAQRLLGSLQVDITKTCNLLDWKPTVTVEEGLCRINAKGP